MPGFTGVIFEFFQVFFIERFFAFPNGCVIDISVGAILGYVKITGGFKGFFVEDIFVFSGYEESLCHKLVKEDKQSGASYSSLVFAYSG